MRDVARIARRFVANPLIHQPLKAAQQEMARAAGGVDHPHLAEPKLADGWGQRAVENECLDKLRRLQQRIAFARRFGQVLVQIAQEARIPVQVGEIVHQPAGVRVHLLPELAHRHRRVATDTQPKDRVVRLVKKGVQTGQRPGFPKAGQQKFAVALQRVGAEVGLVAITRQRQAARLRCTADPRAVNELVILNEADEHTRQQPMYPGLGNDRVRPRLKGLRRAAGVAGRLPLGLQRGLEVRHIGDALAQAVFQSLEQAGQVREQCWGVDHWGVLPVSVAKIPLLGQGGVARSAGVVRSSDSMDSFQIVTGGDARPVFVLHPGLG